MSSYLHGNHPCLNGSIDGEGASQGSARVNPSSCPSSFKSDDSARVRNRQQIVHPETTDIVC